MTVVSNDPNWWPLINAYRITSYFVVAASAGLIYDWVLTFGREVELVWRQHWSLVTVLYLSVRCLGIIFTVLSVLVGVPTISVTDVGCFGIYVTLNWTIITVNTILSVIMITRLHAMYQRSRKVLILLIVIFLAFNIACGVFNGVSVRHILGEELILSGTYQCTVNREGDTMLLYSMIWILIIVWEFLALGLAVQIAVKHFRELRRHSAGGIIGDCFMVLMKTHGVYFASFAAVSCLQFIFLLGDSSSLGSQILFGFWNIFLVVKIFVLGPRLILGVREYHAKLVADSDAATGMTSIAFQERVSVLTSRSV